MFIGIDAGTSPDARLRDGHEPRRGAFRSLQAALKGEFARP